MDIHLLQSFLTLVETGNMTKAADYLHVSQPAMSRQIKNLEQEVNASLFVRTKKGILLTTEGEVLAQYAHKILKLTDQMKDEFVHRDVVGGHRLAIGCTRGLIGTEMGDILHTICVQCPWVRLDILTYDVQSILQKVESGELDIGYLLEQSVDTNQFMAFSLPKPYKWGILLKESDELAAKSFITIDELIQHPLIMPNKLYLPNHLDTVASTLYNEAEHIVATYDVAINAMYHVQNDLGYAAAVASADDIKTYYQLRFLPIKSNYSTRNMLIYEKSRTRTTLMELFAALLQGTMEPQEKE